MTLRRSGIAPPPAACLISLKRPKLKCFHIYSKSRIESGIGRFSSRCGIVLSAFNGKLESVQV
jgi:hypothetical protein